MLRLVVLLVLPGMSGADPATTMLLVLVAAAGLVLLKLASALGDELVSWMRSIFTKWREKGEDG